MFIEGRIRRREYEDKDGVKRFITDIMGDNMTMLSSGQRPGGESEPPADRPENGNGGIVPPGPEDDLPF